MAPTDGSLRIGEFARRVGVSAALLRAWESRYGLLEPVRSAGGFRLYTPQDAERVAQMRHGLDQGLSAAEAARAARETVRPSDGLLDESGDRLLTAVRDFDEAEVHAVLDEAFAAFGLEPVLHDVILPVLTRIGLEWEQGTMTISHEHFASNLVRARLLSLARLWGRGSGPLALLACPPAEYHDLSLLAFGLVLRSRGWRILFLGADTPTTTVIDTAASTQPALTVITSFDPDRLANEAKAIRRLAKLGPLVLSGPGATEEVCARLQLKRLDGDLISAAHDAALGGGR